MAMSEDFLLNFKFGGDAEFLQKLIKLMELVDEKFTSLEGDVSSVDEQTKKMSQSVDEMSESFREGANSISQFGESIKNIAADYLSFRAIQTGVQKIWSFGMESMDAFTTQERAENQLKGVLRNRGTLEQFDEISAYAADLQTRSIYGDEALVKGAGELATYVKGTESLKKMMDILVDYTAGMTGGGEVSPEQMESLATGLGMAYDGNYMAMRRKGFDTSKLEALDAIVESGGVWNNKMKKRYGDVLDKETIDRIRKLKGVTEDMRVDALKEALGDWEGLSDMVNSIDSSAIVKLKNKISDVQEELGKKLYPAFNKLVKKIDSKMPVIEDAIYAVGDVFELFVDFLGKHIDELRDGVKLFADFLKFVSDFPRASVAMVVGLNALSTGSLKFSQSLSQVRENLKEGTFEINKLNTACAVLAGGVAGYSMMDVEQSERSLGYGILGAFGGAITGALAGAKAFGVFGAAAGAAAAAVAAAFKAISAEISAWRDKERTEEEWKEKEQRYDYMLEVQRKANAARKRGDKMAEGEQMYLLNQLITGFEKDYGEGSAGIGLKMTAEGGKKEWEKKVARDTAAAKKAAKEGKGDLNLHNNYNETNIEQHVSVAAELEKIGLLLNQSIRKTIEAQLARNKNIGLVAGA